MVCFFPASIRHTNSFRSGWIGGYHIISRIIFTPTKLFMPITEKKNNKYRKASSKCIVYIHRRTYFIIFSPTHCAFFRSLSGHHLNIFFIWPFWFPFVCICFWFLGLCKWECKSIFVREFYSSFPIKCIQPNAIQPHSIFQHEHWAVSTHNNSMAKIWNVAKVSQLTEFKCSSDIRLRYISILMYMWDETDI